MIMKTQATIMTFVFGLCIFLFSSCQNSDNYIVGKWEIENIGTSDPTNSEQDIHSLTVINMLSIGGTFEFTNQGEFTTETTKGQYSISPDGKTITLKDAESEHIFELDKVSENKLKLQSTSSSSVINLVKK